LAELQLPARGGRQARHRRRGDAVGAIAAARKPDCIEAWVGHHLAKGGETGFVRAGEMAVRQEALRMDNELAIAAASNDRLDGFGGFFGQPATRSDHGDAHARLWLQRADGRNGGGDQTLGFRVVFASRAVAFDVFWSLRTGLVFGAAACLSFTFEWR